MFCQSKCWKILTGRPKNSKNVKNAGPYLVLLAYLFDAMYSLHIPTGSDGLMASTLDSESSDPSSNLGQA